jgi:hypothetical protein
MEVVKVKLAKIKANKENPRTIKIDKLTKLVNSILELPKMLSIRPLVVDENMVVLGGNQRLQALKTIAKMSFDDIVEQLPKQSRWSKKSREEKEQSLAYWMQWLESPMVEIIRADELTQDEREQFIIKDNLPLGDWWWDELANKWDERELEEWGMDVWVNDGESSAGDNSGDEPIEPSKEQESKSHKGSVTIVYDPKQEAILSSILGIEIEKDQYTLNEILKHR